MFWLILCLNGVEIRVNQDTVGSQYTPNITALKGSVLVAGWNDNSEGFVNLSCAASHDTGLTWDSSVVISDTMPGTTGNSVIDLCWGRADTVYAVWHTLGRKDVYFSLSPDLGKTWNPALRLNPDTEAYHHFAQIACDTLAGNIYVCWEQGPVDKRDIFFCKSTDGGLSFSAPVQISVSDYYQQWPSMSLAPDGTVYIAWQKISYTQPYDAPVAVSTDHGETWQLHHVNPSWSAGRMFVSVCAIDDSSVALAYTDDSLDIGDIYVAMSWDKGNTWPSVIHLTPNGQGTAQQMPRLVSAGDSGVLVVWEGTNAGNWDVYWAYVSRLGEVETTEVLVQSSAQDSSQRRPKPVFISDGRFGVIYQDYRNGSSDVYYQMITFQLPGINETVGSGTGCVGSSIVFSDRLRPNVNPGQSWQLLDPAGRVVLRSKGADQVNTQALCPGVYFIKAGNKLFKAVKPMR